MERDRHRQLTDFHKKTETQKKTLMLGKTLKKSVTHGANGTQKEHMEIARLCAEVIAKIFPMTNELTYSSP